MIDVPLSPAAPEHDHPLIVMLDRFGRPSGVRAKHLVHTTETALHLAFSCYVLRPDGRLLLTRRSAQKATWPGAWTNACCGHPLPGESLREAVTRHLSDELSLAPQQLSIALPDFTYRAVMDNGIVEHELCPVLVAMVDLGDADVAMNPAEADAHEWTTWEELVDRAEHRPESLSPWSVAQIAAIRRRGDHPRHLLAGSPPARSRPRAAPPANLFTPLGSGLDRFLDEFLSERRADLRALDPSLDDLTTQIERLIRAGGKRLRPAFVHWGHCAAGGPDSDDTVARLALAVEMLHTFALIHDDVMDRSPLRRGLPSVHEELAALSRRELADTTTSDRDTATAAFGATTESSARFGTSAAIVAGDLAFVWADELLDSIQAEPHVAQRLRSVFTRLRTEVIAGQYLDLRLTGRSGRAATDQALAVALLKSGRYTVTRPLELGATLAGADARTFDILCRYGDAAGVAFQLRDDVLGVFGQPGVTGKSVTDDLRDGKATMLVLRALELTSGAARCELEASLGNIRLDDAGADRCREIVATCGALASVEALIAAEVIRAEETIAELGSCADDALIGLAHLLTARAA